MALGEHTVFSHFTAGRLHDLPVPDEALLHISIEGDVEPRMEGLVAHRPKTVERYGLVDGLWVTSPARTYLDLAAHLDLPGLVAFGDAAWRRTGTVEDIRAVVAAGGGRRGIRLARTALKLLDPRAESAMESRLRVLLILAGLPRPTVQLQFFDEFGREVARVDLAFPEWLVAVEYEGGHHLTSREQWNKDIVRYEYIAGRRWTIIRVTAEDFYRRPEEVVARVRAAIARADA